MRVALEVSGVPYLSIMLMCLVRPTNIGFSVAALYLRKVMDDYGRACTCHVIFLDRLVLKGPLGLSITDS